MSNLDQERSNALNELRCAGYAANSHPTKPDCVVVNDPVQVSWGEGGRRTEYKHRTVPINRVWHFMDARS